jgi:hypothetical protein
VTAEKLSTLDPTDPGLVDREPFYGEFTNPAAGIAADAIGRDPAVGRASISIKYRVKTIIFCDVAGQFSRYPSISLRRISHKISASACQVFLLCITNLHLGRRSSTPGT